MRAPSRGSPISDLDMLDASQYGCDVVGQILSAQVIDIEAIEANERRTSYLQKNIEYYSKKGDGLRYNGKSLAVQAKALVALCQKLQLTLEKLKAQTPELWLKDKKADNAVSMKVVNKPDDIPASDYLILSEKDKLVLNLEKFKNKPTYGEIEAAKNTALAKKAAHFWQGDKYKLEAYFSARLEQIILERNKQKLSTPEDEWEVVEKEEKKEAPVI